MNKIWLKSIALLILCFLNPAYAQQVNKLDLSIIRSSLNQMSTLISKIKDAKWVDPTTRAYDADQMDNFSKFLKRLSDSLQNIGWGRNSIQSIFNAPVSKDARELKASNIDWLGFQVLSYYNKLVKPVLNKKITNQYLIDLIQQYKKVQDRIQTLFPFQLEC